MDDEQSTTLMCIIPSRNIKPFAKVISCLAKMGEELHIEVKPDKLTLRTVNSARSAFAVFYLQRNFFDVYQVGPIEPDAIPQIKVQLKACQAVFRAVGSVDKCVMRLEESADCRLVFDLHCKLNIKKTYRLSFEQSESMQAVYNKQTPNLITSRPKILLDCASNFHPSLDEISMFVQKNQVKLKSYLPDGIAPKEITQTEMSLNAGDFESYIFDSADPVELTFSLKEFKAILSFSDAVGQQLSTFFERGGRPILFSLRIFNQLEADFVLATLVDTSADMNSTPSSSGSSSTGNVTPSSSGSSSSSPSHRKGVNRSPSSSPVRSPSPMMTDPHEERSRKRAYENRNGDKPRMMDEDEEEEPPQKRTRALWSTDV